MKTFAKTILISAVATLGLTACGSSENVEKLEGVLVSYDEGLTACSAKKAVELIECINTTSTASAKEWAEFVGAASQDDVEAVMALTTKFTELSTKASDMATKAL